MLLGFSCGAAVISASKLRAEHAKGFASGCTALQAMPKANSMARGAKPLACRAPYPSKRFDSTMLVWHKKAAANSTIAACKSSLKHTLAAMPEANADVIGMKGCLCN